VTSMSSDGSAYDDAVLGRVGSGVPDDEVAEALRALDVPADVAARHLARLATVQLPAQVIPLRPRRTALRSTAAGLVVGATLMSGAGVAAASTSRPGDALYGLKSAREHLQLAMARHGETRARLELRLARTRLAEAASLLRSGEVDRAIETLARADAALASARAQGSDNVDLDAAVELDHRVDVLTALLSGGLPDTAADAAREALKRAIDRGAHPSGTHGRPGGNGTPGGGAPTPQPTPTDVPGHPGKNGHPGKGNHPSGRPSEIPSHDASTPPPGAP
jgi:Domain of unknown function (DUF5667)